MCACMSILENYSKSYFTVSKYTNHTYIFSALPSSWNPLGSCRLLLQQRLQQHQIGKQEFMGESINNKQEFMGESIDNKQEFMGVH